MHDFAEAAALALAMLGRGDRELMGIVSLSLRVSGAAAAIAFALGLPLAGLLAAGRFRGRHAALLLGNAALGLPAVVVGLACYLLLSRGGPLGGLGWLFTPSGMVLAQTMLALPVVVALSHRVLEPIWREHAEALRLDGAGRAEVLRQCVLIGRAGLATVLLAAFGRCVAEVGAIQVVGGNIRGETRTMTTAIALETQKGDLPMALALGMVLMAVVVLVTAATLLLGRERAA